MTDDLDLCPNEFGLKELNGCPDKDGDGVADFEDKCPESKGLKNLKVVPIAMVTAYQTMKTNAPISPEWLKIKDVLRKRQTLMAMVSRIAKINVPMIAEVLQQEAVR
ncbi:MAG: hypothetical protein IPJ13_04070 [Saprospiraceae bacterium]|nr:hypothetical protein [Saprospiraceae bacterium]